MSTPLFAQDSVLGIFDTFEKLVELDQQKFKKKYDLVSGNAKTTYTKDAINNPKIDSDFLLSTIFRSPSRYFSFIQKDDTCSFYNLLLSNLLKTPQGKIQNFIMEFHDKNGRPESAMIMQSDFISWIIKPTCPQVIETNLSFNVDKIAEHLYKLDLATPQNKLDCLSKVDSFSKSPLAPYFCQLHETNKSIGQALTKEQTTAKLLIDKIPESKWNFIQNFCDHLDQQEYLCHKLLNANYWKTALERPELNNYAQRFCENRLGATKLDSPQMKMCLQTLSTQKEECFYNGKEFTSLQPKPSCESLSLAINHSTISTTINDCPGLTGNEAITNVARLASHFGQPVPTSIGGICATVSAAVFADYNLQADYDQAWDVKLCFDDKLVEEEICYPSLLGNADNSDISEEKVVMKILAKTRGFKENEKCRIIPQSDYKPALLENRVGCVMTYNPDSCTAINCPKDIYFNERPVKNIIKTKADIEFDYFPNNSRMEKFAQTTLLEKKFQKRKRVIYNLTILKEILQGKKRSLIHGIGCAEDLYPELFTKKYLNQCKPLPFIIDGTIQEDDSSSVVIRTAADDIVAPRIIDWSNVFSAVKTYQKQHPMENWTLYAIY